MSQSITLPRRAQRSLALCITVVLATTGAAVGQSASGSVSRPLIWATSWDRVPVGLEFVTPMMWLKGPFDPALPDNGMTADGIQEVIQLSKAMPVGRRVLIWARYATAFWGRELDLLPDPDGSQNYPSPWQDLAIQAVTKEWSRWLLLFRFGGGQLDFLIGDCEMSGSMLSWAVSAREVDLFTRDPLWRQPKYGLPSLQELMKNVSLTDIKAAPPDTAYLNWNLQMGRLTTAVMMKAIWEPAIKEFPAIQGSNYDCIRATDRPGNDLNGHAQPNDNIFGTSSAPSLYGVIQGAAASWFINPNDPTQLSLQGSRRLQRGPWESLLIDQQRARSCRRPSPAPPLTPWIAVSAWSGDIPGTVGYPTDTRYFDENIRHTCLLSPSMFLWWNPGKLPSAGKYINLDDPDVHARKLDALLREVNTMTHGRPERPLTIEPISFEAQVLTTGALCEPSLYVWRTTVAPGVKAVIDLATGAKREVPPGQVGWWDITSGPDMPRYQAVTSVP
jgi:hypothetical protein